MKTKITAVILAGGKASRMEGKDKGLQLLQNKPLIEHCLQHLTPQVSQLMINANRHHNYYTKYGYTVFGDDLPNFQGPLSGMLSALEKASTPFCLFVPCDNPTIPHNLVEKLSLAIKNENTLITYAFDGEQPQPTYCLINKKIIPQLRQYLQQGNRKIMLFLQQNNAIAVDFSQEKTLFQNINTLDELHKMNKKEN